tara:strand:- start:193077 stop:197018 length:3942 start_codon:yes stop_codon:yes gene_type:complete
LKQSIFHKLSSVLWSTIVILIVLLAIYVSVGRMLSSLTGAYQTEILQELNHRVPFFIDAHKVSAEWRSFTPVIVLEGLRLTLPGEFERSIELSEGRIAFDVAGSLTSRSLQVTLLRLKGLNLAAELDAEGAVRLRGFNGGDPLLGEWLESFLLNVERLALRDARLNLLLPDGEQRDFTLDLALSREGSRRQLKGRLSSSRGLDALVLGDGVGNPFEPGEFSGQLYLDLAAPDVAAVTDLFGEAMSGVELAGGLDLALWSNWGPGQTRPSVEFRIGMDRVLLSSREASSRLPLDRIQFAAALVNRGGGWGLDIAELELQRGETLLQIPRMQMLARGETLKLQAQALPLAPLAELLADTNVFPPAGMEVLSVLQPQGIVSALELDVTDISAPLADWQLAANFSELAVAPWHGAPGVAGATGYVHLSPGSGFVVLDSQQFSMDFPTVYAHALRYDDFHGTIFIDWNEELVRLSSGLVEARGDEGRVPVKFGLSIPLTPGDVGIEMDLLVGLEKTDAGQRQKYIPHILDQQLRDWLAASIGDGRIEQGGFLWRGSLKGDAPTHHTVQLFFNIMDTTLDYDPRWPSLTAVDGTVLIDNSNVSVWAKNARLMGSSVEDLSVEVWATQPSALWLAFDASLAGPAADALAVINDSPLSGYTGGVFADADLRGELETELSLLVNLSDKAAVPEVDVVNRFSAVELDLNPGNLPLRDIYGVLSYTTAAGFSSRDLRASLWGEPVQVVVEQLAPHSLAAVEDGQAVVTVKLSSAVELAEVQEWLGLPALDNVGGRTEVEVQLAASAGATPRVSIDTDLRGVSLDLPLPWDKSADSTRPLHVDLGFAGGELLVGIEMAGGLSAQLSLEDGQLRAAALGIDSDPMEMIEGLVSISGHVAFADVAQWEGLLDRYLASGSTAEPTVEVPALGQPVAEAPAPLHFSVDQLQIDQLVVGGWQLGTVTLGLADEGEHWRLRADAGWLRGELLYRVGGASLLDIEYIDLAGLDDLARINPETGEGRVVELPELDVTVGEMRRGDTLLGNLAFKLYSDGENIHAHSISGEIGAMQIRSSEPASLVWRQGLLGHTAIESSLHFEDFGDTLQRLGYERIIVTEDGSFQLTLDWPGGPQDFSLEKARGSLLVDIGAGTFPDVSGGASGTLRVVSILNLTEIVQRLSLSHMFESGVPFDKVDGEVIFHGGTIDVARMDVDGGASSFQFSGVSEVASRTLDGELVVTLPVASNLPWLAAFTAGLPVAAGVFVLSKLFENQVNRLTSAVYSVTGTWDDPQVEFDRVFDDTEANEAGQTPAAKQETTPPAAVIPVQPASP